jgi:hypothetical protein
VRNSATVGVHMARLTTVQPQLQPCAEQQGARKSNRQKERVISQS